MKFKEGDKVRCIPGFTNANAIGAHGIYAGRGYHVGREFVVGAVLPSMSYPGDYIIWDLDSGKAVYAFALELANWEELLTQEEVQRINKLNKHE